MSSDAERIGELSEKSGDIEVDWTIKPLLSHTHEDKVFFSREFYVAGCKWNLGFCPNYIEGCEAWIFCGLYSSENKATRPKSVDFSLTLKQSDGSVMIEEDFSHTFRETHILHGRILIQKSKLAPQEDFTVTCNMHVDGEPNSTARLDKLSRELTDMFTSKRNCDVNLNVSGTVISAHKTILAARSPVLAKVVEIHAKKKWAGTEAIEIKDCDPESFQEFLLYLYSGRVENLSQKNLFDLCIIAHTLDVQQLEEACFRTILDNLSVDNVLHAFILANGLEDTYSKGKIQSFFNDNCDEVVRNSEWVSFSKENEILANELLKSMAQSKKRKHKEMRHPYLESSI